MLPIVFVVPVSGGSSRVTKIVVETADVTKEQVLSIIAAAVWL